MVCKRFFLVVFGSLFMNCSVYINYDYDKTTNFDNYISYGYFPDLKTGMSSFDDKRLFRVLDSTLQSKGFTYSEEPDFFINILSEEFREPPQNLGVGIGGTGGNVGGGVSVGVPLAGGQLQRSIQFDFVDAQGDYLFWQAVATSKFMPKTNPTKREEQLRKVVEKVFSKFPPTKK